MGKTHTMLEIALMKSITIKGSVICNTETLPLADKMEFIWECKKEVAYPTKIAFRGVCYISTNGLFFSIGSGTVEVFFQIKPITTILKDGILDRFIEYDANTPLLINCKGIEDFSERWEKVIREGYDPYVFHIDLVGEKVVAVFSPEKVQRFRTWVSRKYGSLSGNPICKYVRWAKSDIFERLTLVGHTIGGFTFLATFEKGHQDWDSYVNDMKQILEIE